MSISRSNSRTFHFNFPFTYHINSRINTKAIQCRDNEQSSRSIPATVRPRVYIFDTRRWNRLELTNYCHFLIFSSWTLKLDYFLPNLITKKFQYQFSCLNVSFFILEKVNKLELILSEFISRIFWNKKCKFVFQFVFVLIIRRFLVCVRKFLFFRALCFAFSLSVMCKIMEEPLEVNEWFEM